MRLSLFLFLLVALAAIVCAPPAEEAAVDEDAAEQAAQKEADIQVNKDFSKQWDAAAGAGDVETLLSIYTDDAIRMMPDTPALIGKEAIRGAFQASFGEVSLESNSQVEEVRLAGDWAFVRGTFTSTVTPKAAGEPFQVTGTWIDIRERQPDGSWKVSRNMWNSDAPLPEAPQ